MMKNKETIIPLLIFITTFVLVIIVFFVFNNSKKNEYSCYDSENNITYSFDTEEEMHEVCDNLNSTETEEDKILDSYEIYNDLLNVEEDDFAYYPYVNSDKSLTIIIAISYCNNQAAAKAHAEKWFSDHSYNINDYTVEYEYPCEVN